MGIVEGKVAIVTGGTRGIGFTIVREFLKNGAKVALAGSRQETVDAALAKLAEEGFTDNVMGIAPSLTDPDSVAAAFASVVDRFGRLDGLCLSVPGQRHVQLRVGRRPARRRPVPPVSTSQSHTERPPSFKGRRPFSCICSSKHPHKQYSAFYASWRFS